MTYDSRERSVHDGSPVELYEFTRNTSVWRYTSQGSDYDLGGDTYAAIPIQRTSVEATQDIERGDLLVRLPRDAEAVQSFVAIPPAAVMVLTIRRVHRGDAEVVVAWVGRVINADWQPSVCELTCEPVSTSLRRPGLTRWYGRNCPHALYDQHCRASPAMHQIVGTVTAITGSTITVPEAAAAPASRLAGGFAGWTSTDGSGEQRSIIDNVADAVELLAPPFGLEIGAQVLLHDGCRHTLADCDANFGNAVNYGGFPSIPLRNPFDGSGPTY